MRELLRALDQYSTALKKASIWHNSKEILRNVKEKSKKDYIYEFYCLMRILSDLKVNYLLSYCEGKGVTRNKFPKKPCNKKGRPFFILMDKNSNVLYQICAGSKIKVKHGAKYDAPDISFQAPNASDEPESSEVKLIMDAKCCNVSKGQYNDFAMMIRNLDTAEAQNENILYNELKGIKGNCIISYGKAYTDDIEYLESHRLCEIELFNTEEKFTIISH